VWARLDEVDDAEQEDRPVAELEHVYDLDWRRDVAEAEVVARGRAGASVRFGQVRYGLAMLRPGDRVPDVSVWAAIREEAQPLRQLLGPGLSLLLFYVWDWSPT